jgi:hypothetical protein
MIDASPGTGPNNIHDYVPEQSRDIWRWNNGYGNISLSLTLQYQRHPSTDPSHDSKSVCTRPTVDTNDSLDCTNANEVILSIFPELFEFVSDLVSESETSMAKVSRLNSDYCTLVATAPTILMPSLLDTKNQSNMRIPLKWGFANCWTL